MYSASGRPAANASALSAALLSSSIAIRISSEHLPKLLVWSVSSPNSSCCRITSASPVCVPWNKGPLSPNGSKSKSITRTAEDARPGRGRKLSRVESGASPRRVQGANEDGRTPAGLALFMSVFHRHTRCKSLQRTAIPANGGGGSAVRECRMRAHRTTREQSCRTTRLRPFRSHQVFGCQLVPALLCAPQHHFPIARRDAPLAPPLRRQVYAYAHIATELAGARPHLDNVGESHVGRCRSKKKSTFEKGRRTVSLMQDVSRV
jgi:hypothetical protein